jgi:hypothetical protein
LIEIWCNNKIINDEKGLDDMVYVPTRDEISGNYAREVEFIERT